MPRKEAIDMNVLELSTISVKVNPTKNKLTKQVIKLLLSILLHDSIIGLILTILPTLENT